MILIYLSSGHHGAHDDKIVVDNLQNRDIFA
jgi:hypothetical protein